MKRITCLLLALIMIAGLAACNKAPEATPSPADTKSPVQTNEPVESAEPDETDEPDSSGGYTGDEIEISLAHNLAVGSVLDQASNKFSDLVSEKSDGKIKIVVYPAAQLGNERDMIEGIQMGTIDICLATTAYMSNIQPEFAVLDLPFIFDDLDHVKSCLDTEVGDSLSEKLSADQDMYIMSYWNSGFRDMLTSKTKLEELGSFSGLQIRAPEVDVYIKMFQALGASPTPIPFSEVYTSIQTGVVEGVEVSADQMNTMKFYEVGSYIAETNHIFTTVVPVCMNSYWDGLDPQVQEILTQAMEEVTVWEWPAFDESNAAALAEMADAGIEVNKIDREALREVCLGVYDEIAQEKNCTDLLSLIRGS